MTLPHEAREALMRGDYSAYEREIGMTRIPRLKPGSTLTLRRGSQSRIDSFMESVTNTAIGFFVSLATWIVLSRAMGIPMSWHDNFIVIGVFTIVSIARQYVLRRLFDGRSPWSALRGWWAGRAWVRRVAADDLPAGWDRGRGMQP